MKSLFNIAIGICPEKANRDCRAMIAAKIANMKHGGDRRSDQTANLRLESAQVSDKEAAAHVSVSIDSVKRARAVQKNCIKGNRLLEGRKQKGIGSHPNAGLPDPVSPSYFQGATGGFRGLA